MFAFFKLPLAALLALAFSSTSALSESHDSEPPKPERLSEESGERAGSELYHSGDFRISRPGTPPRSNFYTVADFRPVDPGCYSGILSWATEAYIPTGGGAKFYANERINLRPGGGRFIHRHRWDLNSDPISLGGVTTVSSGGGRGTARVQLWLSLDDQIYRLVTDVQPRVGTYQITSTGPISRTVTEDFHFGFGDHHYSYVNLSQLEAASGHPEVAAALNDIRAVLRNRPPNVYMGFFDWSYDEDGHAEDALLIEDEDRLSFGWGAKGSGRRTISLFITCADVLRDYEARFGRE